MGSSSSDAQDRSAALILIVDDEPAICWALERSFRSQGYRTLAASSAEEGLRLAAENQPQLVFLDVRLPKRDGIAALPDFLLATRGAPIIVMTAFGDLETAVAAVKHGASDYLTKPFKLEQAAAVVKRNVEVARQRAQGPDPQSPDPQSLGTDGRLPQGRAAAQGSDQTGKRIVGSSSAIQQAFRQIALVASSNLSVLITGETGTGKELVAEAIHRHSPRADRPYLPIAPVSLNEDLIESELFGHVRGAFTGANVDRAGLFELAEGGTILLDEIGELPLGLQAKLLRVLEQGEYTRVGEVLPRRCDVRILAATNCELHHAISSGRFREDLYWRLNGMHIHLPPLRERVEDIGPLCGYFLECLGSPANARLSPELLVQLSARPWYGNVRELRNAIGHAVVMAGDRALEIGDFPMSHDRSMAAGDGRSLQTAVLAWAETTMAAASGDTNELYAQFMAASEPTLFRFATEQAAGNRLRAAELLGIHRGTLREKMRQYGLED